MINVGRGVKAKIRLDFDKLAGAETLLDELQRQTSRVVRRRFYFNVRKVIQDPIGAAKHSILYSLIKRTNNN